MRRSRFEAADRRRQHSLGEADELRRIKTAVSKEIAFDSGSRERASGSILNAAFTIASAQ